MWDWVGDSVAEGDEEGSNGEEGGEEGGEEWHCEQSKESDMIIQLLQKLTMGNIAFGCG